MSRTTVTMSPKLEEIITRLAYHEETTKCDIIRKSIAMYNYFYKEVYEKHNRIILIDKEKNPIKEFILN